MPRRIRAQSTGQLSLFREVKAPSISLNALSLKCFPGLPQDFDLGSYDTIILTFSGGKDSLACLLLIYSMLTVQGLLNRVRVEIWHHEVDGREGSRLMDWPCTPDYCRAVAQAFHLPIYYQEKPLTTQWFDTARVDSQDSAAISLFLEGESDAHSGTSPRLQDSAYLDGYLGALREHLMQGALTLQIHWLSPAYIAGAFDSPDPF